MHPGKWIVIFTLVGGISFLILLIRWDSFYSRFLSNTRKKLSTLPESPFQYTLAVLTEKGAFCPTEGKPLKMTITFRNVSKKAFPASTLEYVFVSPTPFSMRYSWKELSIPRLDREEEFDAEIYYYPPNSGRRELRFRTTDKSVGLLTLKGKMPMVGNILTEPFRVYSWGEILKLGGALSAIIGTIASIIILFLNVFA